MSIVVRIYCPTGIIRVTLPPDSMLCDLTKQISDRTGVSVDKQQLSIVPSGTPLSEIGIVHGTILNLNSDRPVEFHGPSKEVPEHVQDVKFKSFDSFLLERGFNVSDLPLKNEYLPIKIQVGKMNKIPQSIALKHQPYRHVDHLEMMNTEEIRNFVNYWMHDCEMLTQRCGWMYGYYLEDYHYSMGIRAVCEAIYEPIQCGNIDSVRIEPDDFLSVVDSIAERLGFERIGFIFSHLPRENFFLTSQEIYDIATIQNSRIDTGHYTGYNASHHITCTVSPDLNNNGECVLNAFMVSDMGMALVRDGLIDSKQEDNLKIHLVKPNEYVIFPGVLEQGKETTSFDTSWFLVRVNESAPITNTIFQRENRGKTPNVQEYFMNANGSNSSPKEGFDSHVLYSDFHLLLHIAKTVDIDTALAICDSLIKEEPIDGIMRQLLTE